MTLELPAMENMTVEQLKAAVALLDILPLHKRRRLSSRMLNTEINYRKKKTKKQPIGG